MAVQPMTAARPAQQRCGTCAFAVEDLYLKSLVSCEHPLLKLVQTAIFDAQYAIDRASPRGSRPIHFHMPASTLVSGVMDRNDGRKCPAWTIRAELAPEACP